MKKNKSSKNKRYTKTYKRIISFTTAMAICFGDLPLAEFNSGFKRISSFMNSLTSYAFNSATNGEPVYINSLADLVDYSQNYDSTHVNDTLVISFADGLTDSELTGFTKIGTAEAPFDGLIKVAPDTILNLPTTMFAYITDDVGIIGTVSGTETDLVMSRTNAVPDQPLFAENVVHSTTGTGGKEWKLRYDPFNGSKTSQKVHDFAGYIGTLGEDANIKVSSITHNNLSGEYTANITATGDVGLVCQTMGVNSTLEIGTISFTSTTDEENNITYNGTNNYSVSSTSSGNAGGLVGSMANGAKLILGTSAANPQQEGQFITAESGYAGGIVGKCDGGAIKFNNTSAYSVAQDVSSSSGSGAIAGYYNTVSTGTFPEGYDRYSIPLAKVSIASGYKANGTGNCGSYFGELNNDGTMAFALPALSIVHDSGAAASFGGLVGKYSAVSLANTLTISSTGTVSPSRTDGTVANYGGLIGLVDGATYINVNGVTVNSLYANATSNFGGLIGKAQDAFVELTSTNTISYGSPSTTATFAGVVGDLKNGVLYLQGTTNLSGAPAVSTAAESSGQVVGYRDYALVFATDGWTMTRSSNKQTLDDVGSWGEIVRFDGDDTTDGDNGIKLSDVLTINTTDHYVTLKPAVTEMETTTDFVKTALNIQLNKGQTAGALRCSGSNSSALLSTTLSLKSSSTTIDLSGTGITGLTRDDTSNCTTFSGTFNGNEGSIKLTTGEPYFPSNSTADGKGKIYRHAYNGLFAKTNNATIQNLKIAADSSINVNALSPMYVGNVVGQATGGLTLDTVEICGDATSRATISNAGSSSYFGGFVGNLTAADTVNITGCTYNGEIKGSATISKVGGIIGAVTNSDTDKVFDITIGSTTVGGIITATGNDVGGAIAVIESSGNPATYKSKDRTLKLNALSISGLNINGNGGFLGNKWYETDVEFKASGSAGVTVSGSSSLTAGGNSAAGLVHTATGYWKVNASGINITSMTVNATDATDFGLLINNGHAGSSAIYLELAPSALSVTKAGVGLTLNSNVNVFDELVAHTIPSGSNIAANGQGIVSIATANHALLTMASSGTPDTYQHQTAYLDSNTTSNTTLRDNSNTRYYYNLDAYREAPTAGAQQLLIWSVKQYAHDTLKDYFNFSGKSISGSLDMEGYSYYPVDLDSGSLSLTGDVHLYNEEFDSTEGKSGTDSRLSNEGSQHYMMQNSLFRNVKGSLTFSGSLNGTVSEIGNYCGALVMGEVSSSAQLNPATVTVSSLELNGAMISDAAGPLLINKAGSNATISISNVSNDSTSYTSKGSGSSSYIAKSLLGNIGTASSEHVNLSFSGIKLDGRNNTGVNVLPELTNVYHSNGCLFSDSILVDTLAYTNGSGSYGVYNFTHDEDWGSGNRNVTYGSELYTTVENRDDSTPSKSKQQNYNDTNRRFIRPDIDSNSEYTTFGTNFKNYVKPRTNKTTGYDADNNTHELRVNVPGSTTKGCGTYNDPYMIRNYMDFEVYVDIINGENQSDQTISVPTNALGAPDITANWCNGSHITYTELESENWRTAEGVETNQLSNSDLREYLAGAYYKIDPDLVGTIDLPSNFDGISANVTDSKYVFRGVIDGSGMTIKNNSSSPLIVSSNGCVIYNLKLEVQPASPKGLTQSNYKPFNITGTYNTGRCESYGAVIGQIFGGDNIIDNVSIKFTGPVISKGNASKANLVPIGGYVGVVVNGGLIFRGMDDYSATNDYGQNGISSANLTGFNGGVGNTPSDPTASDNTTWLYINPIVGRVLNGYAITESSSYKPFEDGSREYPDGSIDYWHVATINNAVTYDVNNDSSNKVGVTMRNGTKNYSIADISTNDTTGFNMTGIADGDDINISSAQGLFIMSLITQSGLGKSSTGEYSQLTALKPYDEYMATHHAEYTDIGTATSTDNSDYDKTSSDKYAGTTGKIPYIIKKYTNTVNSVYPAFDVMGDATHSFDLTFKKNGEETQTFYLPDSYRGLGSLTFGGTTINDDFVVFFSSLVGNGNNMSLNMNLQSYTDENYYTLKANQASFKTGFAFIDCLCSSGTFSDLTIHGNVDYKKFGTDGAVVAYDSSNVGNNSKPDPAVSAFVGVPVSGSGDMTFDNINVDSMAISGMCYVGGFVGAVNIEATLTFTECGADNLKIFAGGAAGGLIGYFRNNNAKVVADFATTQNGETVPGDFGIISIVSSYAVADAIAENGAPGAGGLIGYRKTGITNAASEENFTISNVNIKNGSRVTTGYIGCNRDSNNDPVNPNYIPAGGIIGNADAATILNANKVTVENLDIWGAYAGGFVGKLTNDKSKFTIRNSEVKTTENVSIKSTYNNAESASGGFVGKNDGGQDSKITDSKLTDYAISGYYNVGGLIGHNSTAAVKTLNNISVSGHTLTGTNNVGGLVGYQQSGSLNGYNILMKDQTSSSVTPGGSITNNGYIVGNNNSQAINLVGFSRQGMVDTAKMVGNSTAASDENYGSGGYVVFADYKDAASGENPNVKFSNMQSVGTNVGEKTVLKGSKTTTEINYTVVAQNSSGTITKQSENSVSSSSTSNGLLYKPDGVTPLEEGETLESFSVATKFWKYIDPSESYIKTLSDLDNTRINSGFNIFIGGTENQWVKNNYNSSKYSIGTTGKTSDMNVATSNVANAGVWHIVKSGSQYKLYVVDNNGASQYIKTDSNGTDNLYITTNPDEAQLFTAEGGTRDGYFAKEFRFKKIVNNTTYYLGFRGGKQGLAFNTNASDNHTYFQLKFVSAPDPITKCTTYESGEVTYDGTTISCTGVGTTTDASSEQKAQYDSLLTNTTYEVYVFSRTVGQNDYVPDSISSPPYVTTNPRFDITKSGGTALQWLTGDGISGANYYGSAAYGMIKGNANKKYQATGLQPTQLATLETRLVNNMTTIKSASTADPSSYNGEDFPVLVINDIDTANVIINNYLKLLTNTSYNFSNGGTASVYNVDISKWLYRSTTGKFELQDGEAALKRNNTNGFYITTSDIDNDKWQISLIDVQFYDPSDTSANKKIAYHVFVPVVVTKMLHYLINIRAASTTSYTLDAYPSSVQNLIENLGNPITMKVTYTYRQTAAEWADAINNGESVYRNYEKTLTVKATGNIFPADAIIVLVDPNNNKDKYYTSGFKSGEGGILTNPDSNNKYELKLSDFTEFDLVKLNDLMNITATEGSGNLVECGIDDENLVCVVRNGKTVNGEPVDLPLRYKNSTDNESTIYYTVSVALKDHQSNNGYVQENYYLSIFTKENKPDTSIYHYEISSTANETFGDSDHPSARIGGSAEAPHLFLGNLYTNDVTITEQNRNRKMDSSNNYLEAELKTKIGFTTEAKNGGILDNIRNDNVKIYQTFMVSLNRLNGSDGNERGILVDPINIEYYDYIIGDTEPSNYHLSYKKHKGYIELPNECNIKSYLIAGATRSQPEGEEPDYTVEIKETVKLTYAAGSLPEQFPKSTADSTTVGTKMIGYSNISSTKDGGSASRASDNTDNKGTPLLYYIENDTSVTFSYNAVSNSLFDGDGNGNFGQLGVDGYELDESAASDANKFVQIKTAGLYDAHEYSLNSDADYVKIRIKLSKKSDYSTSLDILTYLNEFKLLDNGGHVIQQIDDDPNTDGTNEDNGITVTTDSADSNVVVYIVPKTLLESSENIYSIPIQFKVWSGNSTNFEGKNGTHTDPNDVASPVYDMEYSNYKVLVTVCLLATDSETGLPLEIPLKNSEKSDHIIYTNAKLYSEVIS